MKKILTILTSIFIFFWFFASVNASCKYYDWQGQTWLNSAFESCFKSTDLAWTDETDLKVDWKWFQELIKNWRNIIAVLLWIWAVFWIVFSAFTLATSWWSEEKISKAKNIFQWSIIWLLVVIFASVIITFIVKLFYTI